MDENDNNNERIGKGQILNGPRWKCNHCGNEFSKKYVSRLEYRLGGDSSLRDLTFFSVRSFHHFTMEPMQAKNDKTIIREAHVVNDYFFGCVKAPNSLNLVRRSSWWNLRAFLLAALMHNKFHGVPISSFRRGILEELMIRIFEYLGSKLWMEFQLSKWMVAFPFLISFN